MSSGPSYLRAGRSAPSTPIALLMNIRGDSAPEPDLAVVVGPRERYEERHPGAEEVSLIVEVASSPAAFATDRRGLARYAFAMIPTVWIVGPARPDHPRLHRTERPDR